MNRKPGEDAVMSLGQQPEVEQLSCHIRGRHRYLPAYRMNTFARPVCLALQSNTVHLHRLLKRARGPMGSALTAAFRACVVSATAKVTC